MNNRQPLPLDVLEKLTELAKAHNMSVSEYARLVLINHVKDMDALKKALQV